MIIQHNMLAYNANRQFKVNTGKTKKLSEKLASGYKINRAADDAAGLAMSEKMRRQIRGLDQSAENIQEGIGYVQTADGALNEVQDIMQRINELAVKSANDTNTKEDREYIDEEVQHLKGELAKIFSTTSFNDKEIWGVDANKRIQIGSEYKQAVEFNEFQHKFDITNDNCGVIAYSRYTLHADEQGVNVSWTGYDGQDYETEKISWNTLKKQGYSFEMSDYFGQADGTNKLYNGAGNPVFKNRISFEVVETATVDDMIQSINGTTMSGNGTSIIWGGFETNTGASTTSDMSLSSTSFDYNAAYVAHANGTNDAHNFNAADDAFIEPADSAGNKLVSGSSTGNVISAPSATTVADARTSTEGWAISFYMDGIGKVTANSSSVSYRGNDTSANDEGYWWKWATRMNNGSLEQYKSAINRTVSGDGSLGAVMDALTGAKGTENPGLLTDANGGASDSGGTIYLGFEMTADTPYSYGKGMSGDHVGYFTLKLDVSVSDTETTVLQKIKDSLSGTAIFDFNTSDANYDHGYINSAKAKEHEVEIPIWGGTCEFFVQGGTEAGEHIAVRYDSLSLHSLGLENLHVKTQEASGDAIHKIKSALQEVSTQRANFGAYQNRLEHAYNVNKNTEENTQASDSVIRDTDMADTMVAYSNQNILLQAGQAMIAQANQSNQGVLSLLQ